MKQKSIFLLYIGHKEYTFQQFSSFMIEMNKAERENYKLLMLNEPEIDFARLKQMIEASFERRLVDWYFQEPISMVIVENQYRGAVVLKQYGCWVYMDKLGVIPSEAGNGLGSRLFEEGVFQAAGQGEGLFWRCNAGNERVNGFYLRKIEQHKGGYRESGKWVIYWIGGKTDDLEGIIDYAVNKPESFIS